MVCVVFTWLLVLYAEFVVLRVILLPDIASFYSVLNLILFQALAGTLNRSECFLVDGLGHFATVYSSTCLLRAGRRIAHAHHAHGPRGCPEGQRDEGKY